MQPQFILASLFAGLAAAIADGGNTIAGEEIASHFCDKGKALPGPRGTFCIGVKGENFGLASECPPSFCFDDCDYVKDTNGCSICDPACAIGGKAVAATEAKADCPIVVCNRDEHYCDLIEDANGCKVCPPGC